MQFFKNLEMPRCVMPASVTNVKVKIHTFCDASSYVYGATSYSRVEDAYGQVHCSLLMAKSRLSPIN